MVKKSSEIYPFSLRLPDELKQRLDDSAKAGHRLLTPEILWRLESSFEPLKKYTTGQLIDELTDRLKTEDVYLRIGSPKAEEK